MHKSDENLPLMLLVDYLSFKQFVLVLLSRSDRVEDGEQHHLEPIKLRFGHQLAQIES